MSFDLDAYRSTVAPVQVDDIDFSVFTERPLSPDTLRALRFMHDVESHTVCYLRDLLLTHGHQDPRITTFLTMWNYEEYWHGVAIARILEAHGEPAEDERIGPMRARLGWKDRFSPLTSALGSSLLGPDYVGLHMAWGAVNEWSTAAGYDRLATREGHPVLSTLLSRIARQETRHIAFYATEARERLGRSRTAQRVTRFALKHLWAPVGSPVMPREETVFLLNYLMGGTAGLEIARRIDRRVAALPGLEGLRIVEASLGTYGVSSEDDPALPAADSGRPTVRRDTALADAH